MILSQSRSSPILVRSPKSRTLRNSLVITFLDSYALAQRRRARSHFPMKIFPLRPATSGTGAGCCRAEERAACPRAGVEVALSSPALHSFLPARSQADKKHLFTAQTGTRCTKICHIAEIRHPAYHFQSIQESVKENSANVSSARNPCGEGDLEAKE